MMRSVLRILRKRLLMMKEPQFNKAQNETSMKESEIPSVFSDDDLYLFGQGKEYRIYEKMGAHVRNINGMMGTSFAAWAPNALAVSVIGDFNDWRRDGKPMQLRHHAVGAWQRFVQRLPIGRREK